MSGVIIEKWYKLVNFRKKQERYQNFLVDPDLKYHHNIGDVGLAKKTQQENINDLKEGRIWQLLIEQNG